MQNKYEIEELIAKLFSEDISPEEKVILTAWFNESAENKSYFAQLKNIWINIHPVFDPNDIDVIAAETKVLEKIKDKKWTQTPLIIWWQRVAAIIILPICLLAGYLLLNKTPNSYLIASQEITSPFGMRSKVDLPDGSTVWLNSGSKLKYPVVFAENERNVSLSGEAFFKVHADKKHPFIVKTERVKVRATGTQFNVEAYKSDTITAVTLVEGKVLVDLSRKIKKELNPNQRLVISSISKNYQLYKTDAAKWALWKDGILAFRDERLDYVYKKISQMYNIDIEVKDPVIAAQLYHATFRNESLDEILQLIKLSAPIRYERISRIKQADEFSKEKLKVYKE
jgi:Fe2+-dicitrate sensor, membrane component